MRRSRAADKFFDAIRTANWPLAITLATETKNRQQLNLMLRGMIVGSCPVNYLEAFIRSKAQYIDVDHLDRGRSGNSLLAIAIDKQLFEHASVLVQVGRARVNHGDIHPINVLASSLIQDPGLLRLLLDNGADPNSTQPGSGQPATPLCLTLTHHQRQGVAEIVSILLDAGADPNPPSARMMDPLNLAVCNHDAEVTSFLLCAGAQIRSEVALAHDTDGAALLLMVYAGIDPLDVIRDVFASPSTPRGVMRCLLSLGIDTTQVIPSMGESITRRAALHPDPFARKLIKAGDYLVPGDTRFFPFCCSCRAESKAVELYYCAHCKWIAYCGEHCQRAHWPKHKEACRLSLGL